MRLAILTTGFIAPGCNPHKLPRIWTFLTALAVLAAVVPFAGCSRSTPGLALQGAPASAANLSTATEAPAAQGQKAHTIRATGLIRALESQSIRVPQLAGPGIRLTVTRIITNGSKVSKDDVLAQFDPTAIVDTERDAKAKLDDLSHQFDQKKAQVSSDGATREALIRSAEADLEKALLQLRKGPILSEIDRLKNQARAENAKLSLASLKKSDEFHKRAETAMVRIQELKVERQRLTLERTRSNLEKLQIRAPQDGMVALENTWRSGSMGPAREGDDLYPGMPLIKIFNPLRMVVEATVNESDVAWLGKAAHTRLFLDAYPGAVFDADLESASPVATSGFDTPVRAFTAMFRIRQQDPRLLPDLSAALEIETAAAVAERAPAGVEKARQKP
jgi:multidrug resistance efflux pump